MGYDSGEQVNSRSCCIINIPIVDEIFAKCPDLQSPKIKQKRINLN